MRKENLPTIISYSDLDLFHFNKLAKSWKLNFQQLRPGKLSANLSQYIINDLQLGYVQFNASIKQEGVSPPGVWTFAFINDVQVYWRNYKVPPNSIIIYGPESEVNAVSEPDFKVITFSISDSYLLEVAKEEQMVGLFESLKHMELVKISGLVSDELKNSILEKIKKGLKGFNAVDIENFKKSFTKSLLHALLKSSISKEKVSGKKRLLQLKEAEKFILKNLRDPISVVDIARHLQVSERTLLYAFKNRFSMGTKAYINTLRLNHVHHALYMQLGKKPVASIARESGFWHMGQFFKDYKRFFGVLPSKTLNSARLQKANNI